MSRMTRWEPGRNSSDGAAPPTLVSGSHMLIEVIPYPPAAAASASMCQVTNLASSLWRRNQETSGQSRQLGPSSVANDDSIADRRVDHCGASSGSYVARRGPTSLLLIPFQI